MASMTTKVDSTAQFLDWFKKPFPRQTFTSFTAGMPKRLSSAASRNPPKPQPGSMQWLAEQNKRK
jgi:hypothetical protein